ncbi:MAG: nitroreductase family protein [Clostridia bacterium]|nr:nitroreductase family protein [Clostridia bacterium]
MMTILEAIKTRRTIRKFDQTPLSKEQLAKYIDASRLAPSAANLQPLRYVAVQSREMAEKMFELVKWAGYLAPDYDPKEGERPVAYIAVCSDKSNRSNWTSLDLGAAVENMILAALSDGVGACWIGSVNYPEATKLLALSEDIKLECVVALGYPKEEPKEVAISEDIKYYVDETGTLCVPKYSMDDVLLKTV